jgi:phage terminase large subunit-like protein
LSLQASAIDGYAYVIEDNTCKAGPATWGKLAATTFERHSADLVIAEKNYGGEMVRFVLQAASPDMPVKIVTASRGKVVRAEPIAALTEQGKIRFAGSFPKLEDELCSFTPGGYMGAHSPNRADALVWAMSELFPGIARPEERYSICPRLIESAASTPGWRSGQADRQGRRRHPRRKRAIGSTTSTASTRRTS